MLKASRRQISFEERLEHGEVRLVLLITYTVPGTADVAKFSHCQKVDGFNA
jgi:hypothetical protein